MESIEKILESFEGKVITIGIEEADGSIYEAITVVENGKISCVPNADCVKGIYFENSPIYLK